MTRDEITRMARETGVYTYPEWMHGVPMVTLERFFHAAYAAGAKAEQDRCCKIVYGMAGSDNNAQEIVDAIRKRGQG